MKGTEEFRTQVAVLAGQKELAVTSADPKLEAQRVIVVFQLRADRGNDQGLGR
jgi:hypothetical protein